MISSVTNRCFIYTFCYICLGWFQRWDSGRWGTCSSNGVQFGIQTNHKAALPSGKAQRCYNVRTGQVISFTL